MAKDKQSDTVPERDEARLEQGGRYLEPHEEPPTNRVQLEEEVARALLDIDKDTREKAARLLDGPTLINILEGGPRPDRVQLEEEAARAILDIDKDTREKAARFLDVPTLINILEDGPRPARSAAISGLRYKGEEAAEAAPALATVLQSDPDRSLRAQALAALGIVGTHHNMKDMAFRSTYDQAMLAVLKADPDPKLRGRAADLLRFNVAKNAPVIEAMIRSLRIDPDPGVKGLVATILVAAVYDQLVVEALIATFKNESPSVRGEARKCLERIYDESWDVSPLSVRDEARKCLIRLLERLKDEPPVAQLLEEAYTESEEVEKPSYEEPLPPPEQAIQTLFAGLPDDPRKRLAAVSALYSAMRKEAATQLRPAITELLKEASKEGSQLDYTQKAQLADHVNQVLADARLSLLDPQTKLPAKLSVNRARPSSPSSTLRLADSRKADDGERHVLPVEELQLDETLIELVEHVPGPSGAAARPGRRRARHR